MLYAFLIVLHVIISILLVVAILMQRAKGGGLAGIAGGAASQAVFGGRGAATLIHKITIGLAVAFGVISLTLGILSKGMGTSHSVTQEALQEDFPLDFLQENQAGTAAGEALPGAATDQSSPAQGTETGSGGNTPAQQQPVTPGL